MALPNDKITTTLVASTLGSNSRDVGTLCTHNAINKWSKWKPIRADKVTGINNSDLAAVNYGLDLGEVGNISQIKATGIIYLKPRGGSSNEPYRLGDFRNYNHQAIIPLGTNSPDDNVRYEIYKGGQTSPSIEYFSIYTAANAGGAINYLDLYSTFGTLYLGVIVKNESTEVWYTNPDPILNDYQSILYVSLDIMHPEIVSLVGVTEFYFFLTNVRKVQGDNYTHSVNDRFYPLTTDSVNRNPIYIDLTYSYPPGSLTFFAFMKNFEFQSNGYQSTATVAFSSIGAAYIGGEVTNAEIEFFSEPTYTNSFQKTQLGSFTLNAEEEKTFIVNAYGPMNSDVFWKIYVAGQTITSGAQIR